MRAICVLIAAAGYCSGADLTGDWLAEVTTRRAEPRYSRVHLDLRGASVTGTWDRMGVMGTLAGDRLTVSLLQGDSVAGTLSGARAGDSFSGQGNIGTEAIAWKFTRPAPRPSGVPRTIDFEPTEFHGYFSASYAPVLHVFPGDTIRTRTFDGSGRDANRRGPGSNPETGPFYVEGALPGDTLVVRLGKLRVNRDSAWQGSHLNGRSVTPGFVEGAKYAAGFNSEWKLDRETGVAALKNPTDRMKRFTVPIRPMLGCISTAPPGIQSYRANELGPFGGNMDYNQMREGATLYLPVFHLGALLTVGDGHAAMGDGELTTTALETSLDVELTVDIIQGYMTPSPRLENADYVMSMGIGGSVADSIQSATSNLAEWIKREYGLDDNEVAVLLGAVLEYDIAELVDPQFNVVAKIPKAALKAFIAP